MAEEQDNKPVEPAPQPPRKRWGLRITFGILGLLLLLVALAPTLLSTAPARGLILDRINASLDGTLAVDSWSFGWFTHSSIRGVRFENSKGLRVQIKSVTNDKGLLSLLGSRLDFGRVVVDSPETLVVAAQPAAPAPAAAPSRPSPESPPPPVPPPVAQSAKPPRASPTAAKPKPPAGPVKIPVDVTARLRLTNGKVTVRAAGSPKEHVFDISSANAAVESLNKPLTFDATIWQAAGGGSLAIKGSATLCENNVLDPAKVQAKVSLEAPSLDLEPLALMASAFTVMPAAQGRLETHLALSWSGPENASAEGSVRLLRLMVSGGPLGQDKAFLDSARLDINVRRTGKTVQIRTFKLDSPVLAATAGGELLDQGLRYPSGKIALDARADLARLARELPHTLRIVKGLTVSSGNLSASADIQSSGDLMTCLLNAGVTNVEARKDGERLTLDDPVKLNAKILLAADGPRVERLDLSSAFAKVSGHGDLKDLQVTLNANIAAAMKEIRKFVDLGKLQAAGRISGEARIRAAAPAERHLSAAMTVTDLRIAGASPNPFAMESLKAKLDATARLGRTNELTDVTDIQFTVESVPLTAGVSCSRLTPGDKPGAANAQGIAIRAQGDLKHLLALGRETGLLAPGTDGSGLVNLKLSGDMQKGVLKLSPATADLARLKLTSGNKTASEPRVSIAASLEADTLGRVLTLSGLTATMSAGTVECPRLTVADWDAPTPAAEGTFTARMSLDKLAAQFASFLSLPPGTTLSGSLDGTLSIAPAKNAQVITLDALLRNLLIRPAAGASVTEPEARLSLKSEQSRASGDIAIKVLTLSSATLGLTAEGSLKDPKKDMRLTLDGTLECDFKRIGDIVTAFGKTRVDMEGKRREKFHLKTSLGAGDTAAILRSTDATASLYLARLKTYGIEVGPVTLNATAAKGLVKTDVRTKVNGGDLQIAPQINVLPETAVLTVPDQSLVLRNVNLTEDMMSELLSKISPVFRGCGIVSGQMDLLLSKTHVPLDERMKNAIRVEGRVDLKKVTLQPGGLLQELLDVTGMQVKPMTISDQPLTFVCKDGKIRPSPLTVGYGSVDITFEGTMTLDGALNYVAKVPLTEEMVGAKTFKYVKDVVIQVPIEGTVSAPSISKQATKKAIGDLARKAAENALKEEAGKKLDKILKDNKLPGLKELFRKKDDSGGE